MSNLIVTSPQRPYTFLDKFEAVSNGEVYAGLVDKTDLENPANQIQVYVVGEDGSETPVSQPLKINSGGLLVYNGNPSKFVVKQNYSMLVKQRGKQVMYEPNMAFVDPEAVLNTPSAVDSEIVDGEIFQLILNLGKQLTVVDTNSTRFRVNTGSKVEILYLWKPSGALPSAPFDITDVVQNNHGGYDFTIAGISNTIEFISKENLDLRNSGNIDGWGADDNIDCTNAFIAHCKYLRSIGGVVNIKGTPGKTYLYTNHKTDYPGVTPINSFYGASHLYEFYGSSVTGLVIGMGGCKIKTLDGSHYGSFDPSTGAPVNNGPSSNYQNTPGTIFNIWDMPEGVTGFLPDMDGNNENMVIGGTYPTSNGIQIQHTALRLRGNTRNVLLFCKTMNYMGLDGIAINVNTTLGEVDHNIKIMGASSNFNGRQGLSLSGGAGVTFYGLKCNNTGMGAVSSAPGAGIDMEPETGNYVVSPQFYGGECINNQGVGFLIWDPSKLVSGFYMRDFTLWGTSNHAAWIREGNPDDPYILEDVKIHGQLIYAQNMVMRGRGSIIDNLSHPDYGYYKTASRTISNVNNATFKDMEMNISKQLVSTGGSFDNVEITCSWDGPTVSPTGGQCLSISGKCSNLSVINEIKNVNTEEGRFFVVAGSGFEGGTQALYIDNKNLNSLRYGSKTGPDGNIGLSNGEGFSVIGIGPSGGLNTGDSRRIIGLRSSAPTASIGDEFLGVTLKAGDEVLHVYPKAGRPLSWILTIDDVWVPTLMLS